MPRIFARAFAPLALFVLCALPAADAHASDAAAGAVKYNQLCFTCHGMTGKGDGPAGAVLTPPPRDFSVGDFIFDADENGKRGEDADLALVIKNGAGTYGGNPSMAPWGAIFSEEDVANIIAHIRSLKVETPAN